MNKELLYNRLYEALDTGSFSGEKKYHKLDEVCKQYPYFFGGHFLRLHASNHLQNTDPQLQKNALHVINSFWLQYLLSDTKKADASNPFEKEIATIAFVQDKVQEQIEQVMQPEEQKEQEILPHIETAELENEEDDNSVPDSDKLASVLKEQLIVFEKAVEADAIIPIETAPFYRVDYFAYQGIKLDNQKNDALASKTRRFTDWLRHIRSMNPNPTDLGTDIASENKIVLLAGQSIENPEIITEAMAQVLERQGKKEKAIRLYEKLSFLNPSKSAFFAAKIEELSK